uniref:AIG1-type G domain-containing protein n=1 Tax=Denticeps clupeoides TaxID=299321 RepID=A0AAY3ZYU7_9TELE
YFTCLIEPNDLRLVLLGTTGDGKSSAGNTILGGEFFKVASGAKSLTERSEAKQNVIGQRKVKVVDTPGFLNENLSDQQLVSELQKSITECSPGPHAFVIILSVETFTDQEGETLDGMRKVFGNPIFKYGVILFTSGDELREDQTIEQFVGQNKELKDLVGECGGRCHVVDNKHWNQPQDRYRSNRVQVENLLCTIEQMVHQNGGGCYTNVMLEAVQNERLAEEKLIRATLCEMSEEEIREQVNEKVFNKLSKTLAGGLIGSFRGALFGVKESLDGLMSGNKQQHPFHAPTTEHKHSRALIGADQTGTYIITVFCVCREVVLLVLTPKEDGNQQSSAGVVTSACKQPLQKHACREWGTNTNMTNALLIQPVTTEDALCGLFTLLPWEQT